MFDLALQDVSIPAILELSHLSIHRDCFSCSFLPCEAVHSVEQTMALSTKLALIVCGTISFFEMTLLLIPLTAFSSLTDASPATPAATPETTTPTPTQGFILYLLLSICNWYCLNVYISRYSIPANQCWNWHCISFHPDPSPTVPAVPPEQTKGLFPAIKLNACN